MRSVIANFENFATRRSLYRVWVLSEEADRTRLVSRWINSAAEESEPRDNEDSDGEREARKTWPGINLQFA